jgi:glycyl-tRNA synthetase
MEKKDKKEDLMEKIVSLCKRRGFVFPSSEIYGGLANAWDFGPYGVELKNNIKQHWWKTFVQDRQDMIGLDSGIILNPKVWEASGHTGPGFADPLVECKKCHERYRVDQFDGNKCTKCGSTEFTEPRSFNILMKTFLGSVEGEKSVAYLRGETAQGIFVDFKNITDTARVKIPFGVGQIGKAFRNEITPGNYIFRTREFEQMEIEYFIKPDADWQKYFDQWLEDLKKWIAEIGIAEKKLFFHDIPDGERAHYSKKTIDIEFDFPFGRKELFGLAYRTDYDMKSHATKYKDPETGEEYFPHVIEPSLGVERMMLALLVSAYEEENKAGEERIVLKLAKKMAPIKLAVFPLLKNKPELVKKAKEVYDSLKSQFTCEFDDNGNIGKRYRRQDEIGTPYCITVDFESLEKNDVTVRDRDSMKQERIKIDKLSEYFKEKFV